MPSNPDFETNPTLHEGLDSSQQQESAKTTIIESSEDRVEIDRRLGLFEEIIMQYGFLSDQDTLQYLRLLLKSTPSQVDRFDRVSLVLSLALSRGIRIGNQTVFTPADLSRALDSTKKIHLLGALQLFDRLSKNPMYEFRS